MAFIKKVDYSNQKIREYLFFIGVLFLVFFPKGGFKLAGIPFTWGYLYLGILFGITLTLINYSKKYVVDYKVFICYLATIPFVIYFTLNVFIRGYDGTLGNLVAFYVSFGFLSLLFYLFLSPLLYKMDLEYIESLLSNAVFLISLYGLFLFLFKQITGYYIEIPYLTVNADDLGTLDDKYNMRGSLSKLISTYNNGNIFGVCVLLIFPVFHKINTSPYKMGVVVIALLLTLSRTVWLGLLFYFVIVYRNRLFKLIKIYAFLGVFLFTFGVLVMDRFFQYGSLMNFILDSNLGGRIYQIKQSNSLTLFGSQVFDFIEEIVYLSIFKQLGFIGFILFCLSFFVPIYIALTTKGNNYTYLTGSLTYLFVCLSDGCMLYIPTLAFLYFVNTMIFFPQRVAQK